MSNEHDAPIFQIFGIIAILMIIVAFLFGGSEDHAIAVDNQSEYCEMVEIWNADKAAGILPEKRNGWPPYNGECN